ncbi:hypothetical protein [Clostridium sp. KNHs214]|nr:hypothetical protein [Clostridium sp. KNHs214]
MKSKKVCILLTTFLLSFPISVHAQNISYNVKSGDTLWKLIS